MGSQEGRLGSHYGHEACRQRGRRGDGAWAVQTSPAPVYLEHAGDHGPVLDRRGLTLFLPVGTFGIFQL